jgi:hypothetical protein
MDQLDRAGRTKQVLQHLAAGQVLTPEIQQFVGRVINHDA